MRCSTPTRLYVKSALAAIRAGGVKGLAHITGGGITENLPRVLPDGLDAEIDLDAWTLPPVFGWLAREAGIAGARDAAHLQLRCRIDRGRRCRARAGDVIDAFKEARRERVHAVGQALIANGGGTNRALHRHLARRMSAKRKVRACSDLRVAAAISNRLIEACARCRIIRPRSCSSFPMSQTRAD